MEADSSGKWLETWLKSVSKITNEIAPLEGMINGLLSQTAPPNNVSETILDHDYTLLALKRYGDAAKELWSSTFLGMKRMEVNMVEPIRSLLQNDLKSFKETRRVLEQTQKAYDGLLYRYYAQNKTKEPSSLREDAFQLHEARKAYLKASMDFGIVAPQLRTMLDKVLVKVFSDQWRDMRNSKDSLNGPVRRWNKDIERIRSWSREMETGEAAFRKELLNARKQIEDSTEAHSRPSRELEDYSILTATLSGSKAPARTDIQNESTDAVARGEKQSWLYLRTLSNSKPARTVWVRRWFYVRHGIFGWLVQGSRSGGVEESDRIGVLLCNVRPAQSEERRFAFEVKTKDLSIILQADSQADLVAWMEAFEKAKQIALENPASTDSPAFAISSPPASEFAADSGMYQLREDGSTVGLERGSTLPIPGVDSGFGLPSCSSTDVSGHRRSTGGDRDGESGKDHASRIIQKLDLHRKSTGGPQLTPVPGSPPPSSALAGGGIASLIAASHNVMPVGPANLPQPPPMDGQASGTGASRGLYGLYLSTLAPSTIAIAPAPTNLSATAVIINGERGISLDAMGVISNTWGSSHWGYLNRLEKSQAEVPLGVSAFTPSSSQMQSPGSPPGSPEFLPKVSAENKSKIQSTAPSPSHRKTTSLPEGAKTLPISNANLEYPKSYPVQLKTQDAQFRLLFPNVPRGEKVVLVFRATWSLNEQQELPGRVYVTATDMYFYSHHLGLILTFSIGLDSISEVTAASGRDYDLLFVHLKQSSIGTTSDRITIKAFLEPLKILERRLELLVKRCNSGQPPDVERIIQDLSKLDQSDAMSSPNKDKWEDFTATATSDEGRAGRNNLHAAILLDGGPHSSTHRSNRVQDPSRIKLPRQPVHFVPTGMDRVAVDKLFDISSKALFHVMFGDRSALWQLLYHERQAQRIKQTAWARSGHSHLRRDFKYQIDRTDLLQRIHSTTVTDYQMIDSLNEHLCYVVTDRKTPWALPYGRNLSLLTKIVITHYAKSECRLAIYTKADWTIRAGVFESLVTAQALKDLEMDALDLSGLITDQVRKLGAQSRTKKAIQIFGQVGIQTTGSEFTGSDAPVSTRTQRSIKRHTLAGLMAGSVVSTGRSIMTSVTRRVAALIRWMWKTLDANVLILLVLAMSVLANVFFSSTGTVQWWRDRQVANYLGGIGVGSDNLMSKAVYLQDVHDAWTPAFGFDGSENTCRTIFDIFLSSAEVNLPKVSAGPNVGRQSSFGRLRRSRQRLGSQRHDLMVALRIVNRIEQEMVQAEWEGWLNGENAKCKQAEMLMHENRDRSFNDEEGNGVSNQQPSRIGHTDAAKMISWHRRYCGSCAKEQQLLIEEQMGSAE
ncbi:MAG: hypothetical protein Q9166_004557 [cf. Caloplaca sp. 2 TL-2023]